MSATIPGQVTLLAVDGNSLAHRAWHAITGGDDEEGAFVAAGVLTLVASVWHHGPYDALVVAFDHPHNRRKVAHPHYKAGRSTDPDLHHRLSDLGTRLGHLGVTTIDEDGLEADDLLAAITDSATRRGWHTDVLSGDRDLTALVDDHVRLLRPRATMSDLLVTDLGMVRAEYGVESTQYHDFAALRGDPSDGLPGVTGIGPKGAAALLADHGDLDVLYANLCYLPTKLERALRDGRDVAFHNRQVMRPLAPAVPVEPALDRAVGIDLGTVIVHLEDAGAEDAGLGRAARRLARADDLARNPVIPVVEVPIPDDQRPDWVDEPDQAPSDEPDPATEAVPGDDEDDLASLVDTATRIVAVDASQAALF